MEWILIIWIAVASPHPVVLEYFPDQAACQSAGEIWKSGKAPGYHFDYQCLPRLK
jgi:hypothetical protein